MMILLGISMGIGLISSAMSVSYRDIQYILPVFMQMLMYASPVAYGVSSVPQKVHLLIVDDEANTLASLSRAFRLAGHEATVCDNAAKALELAKSQSFDLVLSDVEMPGMDGYTLTRTIRRTRGWEQVPVIIMTSRGSEEDQRAGLEAGASAYLLKTEFDQNQLVETVRRLVGR